MEVKEFGKLLYSLKIIDQRLVNIFEDKMGVSLTRFQIIKYLNDGPLSTQKQLADFLKIDAAAITRHLKVLESDGYIKRRRNEENNREIYVELTDYALQRIKKCEEETNVRDIVGESFTEQDFENLIQLLNKFGENLK